LASNLYNLGITMVFIGRLYNRPCRPSFPLTQQSTSWWTVDMAVQFLASVLLLISSTVDAATSLALDQKPNPVRKVVVMLQDMEQELRKELEDDKKVYEMLTCWCESNEKEKTAAIELAVSTIDQLEASLKENAAKVAELTQKRKETLDEKNSDIKALQEAKELRMKENKAFHSEEVDLMEAIKACEQSIVVLSKHHPELLQIKNAALALQKARVPELVLTSTSLGHAGAVVLKSFLSGTQGASSFLAIPGFRSYAPQSGQIFGILKQMKADFEDDLSAAQKAEAKSVEEYEALKAAKEDEISTAEKEIVQIDSDIADLGEKTVQESKELEKTEAQLAMDKEFLAKLKEKCKMTDEEFEKRTKSRLEEIAAVEDTIKILDKDESFELFGKTTFFMQISSVETESTTQIRQEAATTLIRAAGRYGMPRLALIATSVQLDEFTKVKAEIDRLLAELKTQQEDEQAHKDECVKELNKNKRETAAAYDKKASLETKKADLEKEIETLTNKIKESEQASKEMQEQMKRASETREAENAAFQQTITDQRLTQTILDKALSRMKEVYLFLQQQPGAAHIATSGTHTDPGNGPARFTKYEENAAGKRIVAMLEEVIAESKKTEAEAIASEEDAQEAYEDFMKDSNKSLKQHIESRASMTQRKAQAEGELTATKEDLMATLSVLEGLHNLNADLHKSCDYLLKNFDARQEARAAEMDALKEAKNILSGMK